MKEKGQALLQCAVPKGWVEALDVCRGKNNRSRAGEMRQALYEHFKANKVKVTEVK